MPEREKKELFDTNMPTEITGLFRPTMTIKDFIIRKQAQSSLEGGGVESVPIGKVFVGQAMDPYVGLLESERQQATSYVPINVQQITDAVRSVLAESFWPSSFDVSGISKAIFNLREQVRDISLSANASARLLEEIRQRQDRQFAVMEQGLARLSGTQRSPQSAESELTAKAPDSSEPTKELFADLASFYRKELFIVIGITVLFLVGMTFLLFV